MPTYDYHCAVCDTQFETQQSIKDDAGASCPKCRVWATKRLISGGAGFRLKGGGWAADNYSSTSQTKTPE